ncbi:MAG: hypothetical protein ACI4NE_02710 [Succinivibrio sp.]
MDFKLNSNTAKPLSSTDQSTYERGSNTELNYSTKNVPLLLPSLSTWKTINFDLDLAVVFSNAIANQHLPLFDFRIDPTNDNELSVKNLHISQSCYYYLGALLNILKYSKNFSLDSLFEISFKEVSKLLFNSCNQLDLKRVKNLFLILSEAKFDDDLTVLTYYKRNGKSPLVQFNNSICFRSLNRKRDYVQIPREKLHILSRLVKKPKAFCYFIEQIYLKQKENLEQNSTGWVADRTPKSDERLKQIFLPTPPHSVAEIKREAKCYLAKIRDISIKDEIDIIAKSTIKKEDVKKFNSIKECHKVTNKEMINQLFTQINTRKSVTA